MTSSVINPLPAMGFNLPQSRSAAAAPAARVVRRGGSLVRVIITLSWMVGITGSFLTVGVIGMFADDLPPIHLKTLEDLDNAIELPMVETSMAELMSMEASADQPAETEPVLPTEIPEAIETPPENLDLPEIAEAMTMEDIFAVPTAPRIEDALRPIDPVIRQTPPAPSRPRNAPVASSGGTRSNTTQAGAAGGSGTAGSGGKGKFPQPSYPDFARSAGMQGTVRLSISVGPSGAVDGVSVIGSTGFSALDEYAASHVRRNWRWPAGTPHRYTLPLTFRLR